MGGFALLSLSNDLQPGLSGSMLRSAFLYAARTPCMFASFCPLYPHDPDANFLTLACVCRQVPLIKNNITDYYIAHLGRLVSPILPRITLP